MQGTIAEIEELHTKCEHEVMLIADSLPYGHDTDSTLPMDLSKGIPVDVATTLEKHEGKAAAKEHYFEATAAAPQGSTANAAAGAGVREEHPQEEACGIRKCMDACSSLIPTIHYRNFLFGTCGGQVGQAFWLLAVTQGTTCMWDANSKEQ